MPWRCRAFLHPAARYKVKWVGGRWECSHFYALSKNIFENPEGKCNLGWDAEWVALYQILIWCGGVSAAGVFSASFKHLVCGGNTGARVNIALRRSSQVVGFSGQSIGVLTGWVSFLFPIITMRNVAYMSNCSEHAQLLQGCSALLINRHGFWPGAEKQQTGSSPHLNWAGV